MSELLGELFPGDRLTEHEIELNTYTLEVEEFPFTPAILTENAITVLQKRYLKKDLEGRLLETPEEMFRRVAKAIAVVEEKYGGQVGETEELFFRLLASLDFLPNSPTLMNAGRELGQLSACFVLPVEDSMEGIFETVKQTALIHKSGGGTGFSFSRLRPKNSPVCSTAGTASGPVSFMHVFNTATETVKQGGTRRGANMAILRVDHPDIMEFITCKTSEHQLTNFNISIAVSDKFMEALAVSGEYKLLAPHTKETTAVVSAREVFDKIVECAWRNGEPGMVFIDRINQDNPTPELGEIESTNPCGEQPLLPYESCNLGSVNLDHVVKDGVINWKKLRLIVQIAVHFLDNVIDANKLPLPQIEEMTLNTRKIGLGVMGFADMLHQLRIPYDSAQGLAKAEEIMSFIREEARQKSRELAKTRGVYPAWREGALPLRNATVTTIAPTGTISMIADASSGIEPNFALAYTKNVLDGEKLNFLNKHFEETAKTERFYSEDLMQALIDGESLEHFKRVPDSIRRVFRTSREIETKWHIRMQAAFQKYTDNAVSKTINFPNSANEEDVRTAFLMAYQLGCKGLTIYRDGCRKNQVLIAGDETDDSDGDPKKVSAQPRKRPRVTKGITERVNTGDGMLYITINEDLEGLCEVFASIGKHGGNMAAQTEAIGRLISLCLRCGVDAMSIVKQLKGIAAGHSHAWDNGELVLSAPDAIGKVLENYIKNKQRKENPQPVKETNGQKWEICPECGGFLIFQETCSQCRSCGYSKC